MFEKLFIPIRKLWFQKKKSFGSYKVVMPQVVSEQKTVPNHIAKPVYHSTGVPQNPPFDVEVKNAEQIQKMRESCRLASNILKIVGDSLKIGMTTDEIDNLVHELTIKHNAYPSPLNYHGFPKSVCTSVNNVACHGIPDDRPLEDGDIINVDITVYLNGCHGDCSKTFLIGNVDEEGRKLVEATEQCLAEAIKLCKPGKKYISIGNHIEYRAKCLGYTVIPSLVGHGIGEYFHGYPEIYHTSNSYPGVMKPGVTFTIEPALTQGTEEIVILEDGWSALTVDNARAAQCEHTILITENGAEILTLPDT